MAISESNPFDITVRPPPTGPAWVDDLPLLQWTVLPNANNAADVQAPDTGQYGNTGPRSVLAAWCGGALCPLFGDSGAMVHWGGGHQDYYGNEVYAFDLATLTWQRLDDPSAGGYDGPWDEGLRADGRPASVHSMFRIGCRTMTGEFYTSVRETNNFGGGQTLRVSRYDLASRTWFNGSGEGGHAPTLGYGGTYDSNRDGVWTHHANNGHRWSFYDFANDAWDDYDTGGPAAGGADLAYCPPKDMVLNNNELDSGFWGLDPTAPASPPIELTQAGTAPTLSNTATVQWSENLSAFVVYPPGGDDLYLLRAPDGDWRGQTWQWESLAVTGSSGEHPYSGATSDKLRVIEWGNTTVVVLNASWSGPAVAVLLT